MLLDNFELNGEQLLVTYAKNPREREDRRNNRDRDNRNDNRDQEIILHRIALSNLSSDTTWQVCPLYSCLVGVPA